MYGLFKSRTGWSETDKLVNRLVTSVRPASVVNIAERV
jgi:hypothetical protein